MAESRFPRNVKLFISIGLILAGFTMYWSWALIYDAWNIFAREFVGAYSIVVVLVGFGILGLLLTLSEAKG